MEMNTPPPVTSVTASDQSVHAGVKRRKVDLLKNNKDINNLEDIPDNSNANEDSKPQLL